MKYIVNIILLSIFLFGYEYKIQKISPQIEKRMKKGNSWKRACPIALADLRYLDLAYRDFSGNHRMGEMIVHKDVSKEVVQIFAKLYAIEYPIYSMKLVSDYQGNDWQSIEAGNTSALNCRKATASKKWSKHAYGKAIDINPIQNPYISSKGRISHKSSLKYRHRGHIDPKDSADKALLLKSDKATKIFKKYGWKWGGEWSRVKDYQHFYK